MTRGDLSISSDGKLGYELGFGFMVVSFLEIRGVGKGLFVTGQTEDELYFTL